MITRCPSCGTRFRVRSEQLAARAGQVRCGKCGRIFDALEYLIEEAARAPKSGPAPAAMPSAETAEARVAPGADTPAPASEAGASAAEIPELPQPQSTEAAAQPADEAYDFGPIAAEHPAARKRRWPWLLGACVLLLALLAQAGYYYRSALIVLFPEAKPHAVALCAKLGCSLPLPRRIELMSIEASDLQADTSNTNIMVLSATLKNRAVFDQELPMLELTLTNAQDQPVVRRVLTPQEYAGKAAGAKPGFAANSEMAIKVYIEGSQVKATGYRVYLFYP